MKSFKSGKPIANWLLRIALIPTLFHLYFTTISTLNFSNLSFYIALIIIAGGLGILTGGFFSMAGITILSGLVVFLLSIYKSAISFNGTFDMYFTSHLIPLAIGFYFFTNGNDN